MAGIYIHIPFCRKACHYCNFHFSTGLGGRDALVRALMTEIDLTRGFLPPGPVETIYFGGGTPSLLPPEDIAALLDRLLEVYPRASDSPVARNAEITLEANPDDIDADLLRAWRQAGINRLSLGVQSFREEDLRWMNRAHSAVQSLEACQAIQQAGFTEYSLDLIYGVPGLTDEAWTQNLDQALKLGSSHLSCYALTVEPGTALGTAVRKGASPDTDPEQQARQFLLMAGRLEASGFEHYEISNFAKPGHRSRHNGAYWQGVPYLGLGPSAHSFRGHTRKWNVSNNALYIQALAEGRLSSESEDLTRVQQLNEYIMTSLRTIEGCDLSRVGRDWGQAAACQLRDNAGRHLQSGCAEIAAGSVLRLTRQGKLFADGIAADLFFVEGDVTLVEGELPEDMKQDRHPDHNQDTRGTKSCE